MRFALVAQRPTPTNDALAAASGCGTAWEQLTPARALAELGRGDVALGRLDVLPTLDGVDDGLAALATLASRGAIVLNGPGTLLAAHDKLLTARVLRGSALPHPATQLAHGPRPAVTLCPPLVVKPRFGSWGRGVTRCDDRHAVAAALAEARTRPWYAAHGALVQELVPPSGYDLRLVVAGGRVVGAVSRVPAPGEWRTNVALGATRHPVACPPPEACAVAEAAAGAIRAALVGVDLLPDGQGGWTVLELNGAVELTEAYGLRRDVFAEIGFELARLALDRTRLRERRAAAA